MKGWFSSMTTDYFLKVPTKSLLVHTHQHGGLLAHTPAFGTGFLCDNPAVNQSVNWVTSQLELCSVRHSQSDGWSFNTTQIQVWGSLSDQTQQRSLRAASSSAPFDRGKVSLNCCFITDLHISGGRINTNYINTEHWSCILLLSVWWGCGVFKWNIQKTVNYEPMLESESAFDVNCYPTMHCTEEVEELLADGARRRTEIFYFSKTSDTTLLYFYSSKSPAIEFVVE